MEFHGTGSSSSSSKLRLSSTNFRCRITFDTAVTVPKRNGLFDIGIPVLCVALRVEDKMISHVLYWNLDFQRDLTRKPVNDAITMLKFCTEKRVSALFAVYRRGSSDSREFRFSKSGKHGVVSTRAPKCTRIWRQTVTGDPGSIHTTVAIDTAVSVAVR